jgi:hypothetical protein
MGVRSDGYMENLRFYEKSFISLYPYVLIDTPQRWIDTDLIDEFTGRNYNYTKKKMSVI